jgi:hypothetical protein
VTNLRDIRLMARQNATFIIRYVLAIAIEIAVALCLLSVAKGEFAWAVWIAYLILASAAVATLIGLSWCWFWAVGVGVGWFVSAILFVVGAWLLTSGSKLDWNSIAGLSRHAH